ncbi:MAG TPA: hypothetical protein VF395_14885 [Polyangiaceae bacterium]
MRLVDLTVLYLVVGAACAVALHRRSPLDARAAFLNALTTVPLWPIFAPIAWTAKKERVALDVQTEGRVAEIRSTLEEAVESVAGTPLERLLSRESARTILAEVERVSARNQELVRLLSRDEFSLDGAERKLSGLGQSHASARVRASARLHLENVRRLHLLGERDSRALEELAALTTALRTQLVLVRLSGSSAEGVNDIVGELWAHIEGLKHASEEVFAPSVVGYRLGPSDTSDTSDPSNPQSRAPA